MSGTVLTVYVPAPASPLRSTILPRSAIVGRSSTVDPDLVSVSYEGNAYGAAGLDRFEDRLRQAWGRAVENYPSVARALVRADELVAVGSYDGERLMLDGRPGPAAALAAWLEGGA